jgi:molybdate transport system ATP-binding protein
MTDVDRTGADPTGADYPTGADQTGTALVDGHLVVDRGTFRLDVRLRINPGQVVALLGPNGAGKTTALRALAGLQPLTDGHVTLAGVDLDRPDRRRFTPPERRPIGVVFQDYLLFPHLSALDNVAFGPRRHGIDRRTARDQAAGWLARVGLTEHARRKPRQLSGGQAQRVALARALAVHPTLLLLDEPLAGMSPKERVETVYLLKSIARGRTVIIIDHDMDSLFELVERVTVLQEGRVLVEGTPDEIKGNGKVQEAYLGGVHSALAAE